MDHDDITCEHPVPADDEAWSLEIATAAERADSMESLRLADGSVLSPDDGRDAVVLAAIKARNFECAAEDVSDLVDAVSELDDGLDDEHDLATIAIRYLAVHSVLNLIAEPDTELVARLVQSTRHLIEK